MKHEGFSQLLVWLLITVHVVTIYGCNTTNRVTLPSNEIPVGYNFKITKVILKTGEIIEFDSNGGLYAEKSKDGKSYRVIVGTSGNKNVEIDPDEVLDITFGEQISRDVISPSGSDFAQLPRSNCSTCWYPEPKKSCDVIILTEVGVYALGMANDENGFRGVQDFGLLVNIGEHEAVGGSFFLSTEKGGISFGPELRYRHWLGNKQSIDLAVTYLCASQATHGTVSLSGLVKWNPVPWFGIALRPEMFRRGPEPNGRYNYFRLSGGLEFGWIMGVIVPAVGVVLLGIFMVGLMLGGRVP